MDKLTVNLHSFVDIITNSSTVIYTYVNSVDAVKEFINEVLKSLPNVTLAADDLYEFEVQFTENGAEHVAEIVLNTPTHKHHDELTVISQWVYPDWKAKRKALADYVRENMSYKDEYSDGWDTYYPETELVLKSKVSENQRNDLGKLLENIFDHTAEYDG